MWESIELRELRVFVALAEELHFGRTARRLRLSQSRVSQVLRSLESQLGGRLVERTSRRVALTPLGHQLLRDVDPALEQLEHALAGAYQRPARVGGRLRIALLTPTAQGRHFAAIVSRFRDEQPGCTIELAPAPRRRPRARPAPRTGAADARRGP